MPEFITVSCTNAPHVGGVAALETAPGGGVGVSDFQ